MKTKIIKQVEEYISKTRNNFDLYDTKKEIEKLFRWEDIQRNKARTKIYKVGDKVQFFPPPTSPLGGIVTKGTVEKVGTKRLKISIGEDSCFVSSTRVGAPQREGTRA